MNGRHHFAGPHRAGSLPRRMRHRRHGGPPVLVGVLLVFLGVLFLLDNLNLIEARDLIGTYWPLGFVAWGTARLLFGHGGERLVGGTVAAAAGILVGDRLLGWSINFWQLLWPLLLITLGIRFLFHGRRSMSRPTAAAELSPGASDVDVEGVEEEPEVVVDSSATFREFAVMASVERKNISRTFRGGQATAFMGSVDIDLRECEMTSDEVPVTVFVMMGEIVLSTWTSNPTSRSLLNAPTASRPSRPLPRRLPICCSSTCRCPSWTDSRCSNSSVVTLP